jgi:hypothetical protein
VKIKTISKQVANVHQRKIKLWEARGTHFFRGYQMDIVTGYTPTNPSCNITLKDNSTLYYKKTSAIAAWEIQPSFASVYCVFSGLHDKPHWQDFPSNQSVIKALVKCKTKQSHLSIFSASRGPHFIPRELLSLKEQDALFEDLLKKHVDHMEQPNLLKELIYQINDNKLLSNHGNMARTSGTNGSKNSKARANDKVMRPLPLEGTTKEDIMGMVEATAMVYK